MLNCNGCTVTFSLSERDWWNAGPWVSSKWPVIQSTAEITGSKQQAQAVNCDLACIRANQWVLGDVDISSVGDKTNVHGMGGIETRDWDQNSHSCSPQEESFLFLLSLHHDPSLGHLFQHSSFQILFREAVGRFLTWMISPSGLYFESATYKIRAISGSAVSIKMIVLRRVVL
jgi:hypothetical protein